MNRRLLLIAGGACLGILALWFFMLWSPKGRELNEAREREVEAQMLVQELEARLSRLQAAEERSPELVATLDRLRSAVPESPNLAQFILDANGAALEAGVDFLSISPSPPAPNPAGGASEVAISLSIKGGYFQVLDFVNRLDVMSRVVVIDTFGLSPQGSEGGAAPELSVSLNGRMFTLAQSGVVAPGASAPAPDAPPAETPTSSPSTSVVGSVR